MLVINELNVTFGNDQQAVRAVRDVNIKVKKGESFGLVGESGSGKSTVLACISGLNKTWTGEIVVDGVVQSHQRPKSFFRQIQMVFQDPYGSLHPRHTIDRTLKEPIAIHKLGDVNKRIERVLDEVGLGNTFRFRFPHQLSGGQRQRIAIARTLILEPKILLLDEPTSALDVSIQAEILNLLKKIQEERQLSYLLVSHDLAVVSHMCDQIAIMNHGQIIEKANKDQLRQKTLNHAYSKQLLAAAKGFDRQVINEFKEFLPVN